MMKEVVNVMESDEQLINVDSKVPEGFSDEKENDNYWLNAVRDFWAETGLGTDEIELRWILNYFDERRKRTK